MAHEVETMAYAGEMPWHGLGIKVPADLTPDQMLTVAGLDWEVTKSPVYIHLNGEEVALDHAALVRATDNKVLDVVSADWNTVQNREAFSFFNDFVAAGDMEMHTAGSLKGGQIVWVLAKVLGSFELFSGDLIEPYLLFSNFHKYGFSTDVRFTPIRVVCNNTLNMALGKEANGIKVSHRRVFDAMEVKTALGIAKEKMLKYKEAAEFLGSRKAKEEDIVTYFTRVFPVSAASKKAEKNEKSRNAVAALKLLCEQPGAEFAEGTWWPVYNSVSFLTDHVLGRNVDTRLSSAWYGPNRKLKIGALDTALEMAKVSEVV